MKLVSKYRTSYICASSGMFDDWKKRLFPTKTIHLLISNQSGQMRQAQMQRPPQKCMPDGLCVELTQTRVERCVCVQLVPESAQICSDEVVRNEFFQKMLFPHTCINSVGCGAVDQRGDSTEITVCFTHRQHVEQQLIRVRHGRLQ